MPYFSISRMAHFLLFLDPENGTKTGILEIEKWHKNKENRDRAMCSREKAHFA